MTLLELMPVPPKMRRLRARLKPECNQRISEEAKRWTSTEYGKAHMARMTALAATPEARAKLSRVKLRNAEANRRREASMACGNPTYRRCRFCKKYDDPVNMMRSHKVRTPKNSIRFAHRSCNAEESRKYRRKKRMAA
jgi:hypothetical protein